METLNKTIILTLILGMILGAVLGAVITVNLSAETFEKDTVLIKTLLARYQAAQGMGDRCAIELGLVDNQTKPMIYNLTKEFEPYKIGFDAMNELIENQQHAQPKDATGEKVHINN